MTKGIRLNRRAMLRGVGGAALALPFLEAMVPSRAQAATAKKRFVAFYTPCGTIPANFWPTGTENNFTLSPILAPLGVNHKEDLLILGGVDNVAAKDGPGDAHQKGTGSVLTGSPLQVGDFVGMGGSVAGWSDGISIDQEIANAIGKDTTYSSLEFGVGVKGAHVGTRISYRGPGRPLPPEINPHRMYMRLFGAASESQDAVTHRNKRRALVLDSVLGEAKSLRDKLGSGDREKLDSHLESIADVESQLERSGLMFGGSCQPLTLGAEYEVTADKNIPAIGKLQMDIMALAFACDLTRVSSLMWTYAASLVEYSWLSGVIGNKTYKISTEHHTIAHKGDEETIYVAQNTAIGTWYATQLTYLIDKLKAIPDAGGTVFDNTAILWVNEHSTGNNHQTSDIPFVIAGSAGGYFKTNKYVRYAALPPDRKTGEKGQPHNKLLVSIANAYGVDTDSFGPTKYGTGALSKIT